MKRSITAAGCFAILLGMAPFTLAQQDQLRQQAQPGQDRGLQRQQSGQRQAGGESEQLEQKLAAWLAGENWAEIQVSQLGTQQANNPQVRQFAERMVQEHTQLIEQLRQINPDIDMPESGQGGQQTGQAGQQRLQQQAQQRTAQSQAAGGSADDPLMRIGKQAVQQKVQLTKTYLQDKQGEEFDKCFMGQQIAAHIGMLAHLQAMQNAGGQQLQQIVSKATQSTEQHLQQAQQIAQSLEGGEGAAARLSRRPGQTGQTQQRDQQQQQDQDR